MSVNRLSKGFSYISETFQANAAIKGQLQSRLCLIYSRFLATHCLLLSLKLVRRYITASILILSSHVCLQASQPKCYASLSSSPCVLYNLSISSFFISLLSFVQNIFSRYALVLRTFARQLVIQLSYHRSSLGNFADETCGKTHKRHCHKIRLFYVLRTMNTILQFTYIKSQTIPSNSFMV